MSDPKKLQECLGKDFQKEPYISYALEIIKTCYEVNLRHVVDKKSWGFAFPIDPEVLAAVIKYVKNDVVVELAGASGENGSLLAFSDAQKVYINDIASQEIKKLNQLKSSLPKEISEKIIAVESNCFDFLKIHPELAGEVDLVLCRNLIHFFNDKQMGQFFQLLKKVLKPEGRVIITANSIYCGRKHYKAFDENPSCSSFYSYRCLVDDQNDPNPSFDICSEYSVCSGELIGIIIKNS